MQMKQFKVEAKQNKKIKIAYKILIICKYAFEK